MSGATQPGQPLRSVHVNVSTISALIDVLPVAFIFLVISLLFFWHLDYQTETGGGGPSPIKQGNDPSVAWTRRNCFAGGDDGEREVLWMLSGLGCIPAKFLGALPGGRGKTTSSSMKRVAHSWLARSSRALPICRPMVSPHPGWSGLGRTSAVASRGETSVCALAVLLCSLRGSAAAFPRSFLALRRKRPMVSS